jgi:hypothetical protein
MVHFYLNLYSRTSIVARRFRKPPFSNGFAPYNGGKKDIYQRLGFSIL